jgi:hypothetical protein
MGHDRKRLFSLLHDRPGSSPSGVIPTTRRFRCHEGQMLAGNGLNSTKTVFWNRKGVGGVIISQTCRRDFARLLKIVKGGTLDKNYYLAYSKQHILRINFIKAIDHA